jgi:hypothetical protein
MMTRRRLLSHACIWLVLAPGFLAVLAVPTGPATAQRFCFWDGSPPIWRGRCPKGFERVEVSIEWCANGFKVKCCEPLGVISQPQGSKGDTTTETWLIQSKYPFQVQLEFYSQDRKAAWPGAGRAHRLYDSKQLTFSLKCRRGETICYGAWEVAAGGKTGSRHWGVGQHNRHKCADCCWTCGAKGNPRAITLVR